MNKEFLRVIEIDINDILPNRNQPRIMLNEEDDLGLTDSIKEYGVLQPILVRSIGDKYEIIAGERRYRASVLAGKDTIPAIVINMNDKESAEVALIENVQRKQLSPIEEALSYKSILDKGYMTQEQLAEKIGKSQPTIANKIRLLNLSDEVQDALLENQISERHARSLLKLKDKQTQNKMLDKIINERLTVRKTDEEIDKLLKDKGEDNMNNNEFNNIPQFQSFESNPVVTPVPQYTAPQSVEPVSTVENTYGNSMFEPVGSIEPAQTSIPQFDIFQNAAPAQPVSQQTTDIFPQYVSPVSEPVVEPVQEPMFNISSQYEAPVQEQPTQEPAFNISSQFEVPASEPVQENNVTLDTFTTAPVQENSYVQPEVKPEPIIITDYNKQYDPVMPMEEVEPAPQGSFKDVVAAIRECNDKIKSLGYKVEVDEFDLTNIYQAIFKIEKM